MWPTDAQNMSRNLIVIVMSVLKIFNFYISKYSVKEEEQSITNPKISDES